MKNLPCPSVAVIPIVAVLLCLCVPATAATYYCSNAGSDQNTGTSDTAAWATLAYAKTKLRGSDQLLLRRGDVFRDSLDLSGISNPAIGAYGQAGLARPVIAGSAAISGWSVYKGSIWVAACPQKIQKLFVNNVMMTLARYPDTGWLRVDTMTENADGTNTVITLAALSQHPGNAAGYWTNAQVRWRRWSWWFETRRVTAYDGAGRLSLAGASVIHIDPADGTRGWGFYLDNKFEELDAPGEWYYDAVAGKVYLYPPGGADPNAMLVEGACFTYGLRLGGGTADNVCFRHQLENGIVLSRQSVVSNCRFEWIGGDSGGSALSASWDIADSHMFGNVFENNLNIGISWYENSGRKGQSVIEYDTLLNTGSFPGYGGTGTWHAVGILVHLTSGAQVRYNYIDKTGYAGVLLGSDSNFVYGNIIKHAMWTLNDGGAIYTDCSRSHIYNNIIYDTKGDLTSSGPWYPLGHGIWLEFLGDYHNSVVENNTVVRSGCNGIYLPNNFYDTVRGNVLFDNAVAQLDLDGQLTNSSTGRTQNLPQGNVLSGNVCYATTRLEKALEFRPEYNYGTLTGNYFCNPFTDSVVSGYGTGNQYYTLFDYALGKWRSLYTWADATAKTDPVKRPAGMSEANSYGMGTIFINESPATQSFTPGPGTWVDLDNTPVTGAFALPAFTSKILICTDSSVGVISAGIKNPNQYFRQLGNVMTYELLSNSSVMIVVYDSRGRRLSGSTSLNQLKGWHKVDLTSAIEGKRRLTQGIYTYVFSVKGQGNEWTRSGKLCVMH
ncbi:MAG TPA: right-handed parallel beta-helix repeat-containing protein [Chitinivibrionales bacterium]|nr:right-handed parallel beta-helix repeat-containing protein [Chitinivibrionales bacterium]